MLGHPQPETTLIVEPARPEHLAGMVRVYKALSVEHADLLPAHGNTGFLLRSYPMTERDFSEVLSEFVLCAHQNGEVLGFILAYKKALFWHLYNQALIRPGAALGDFLSALEGEFIFGHRIGVAPWSRRRDVASHLVLQMRTRIANSPCREMYVGILHAPVRNTASIGFSTRLGFELVAERANPNGDLWGIYRLVLR